MSRPVWCPVPGSCHCERYVSSEELCDTSCLSRLPQLLSRPSPDGLLQLSLVNRDKIIWHMVRERRKGTG